MEFVIGKAIEYVSQGRNFEENMQNLKRKLKELESIEADVNAQLSTTTKKPKKEVENWLEDVGRIKNEVERIEQQTTASSSRGQGLTMGGEVEKVTKEVEELIQKCRFEGGLVLDVYGAEELLAPDLVGEEFQKNKNKILECIMLKNVNIIGIWGMGGSGKTILVTHIHNELRKKVNVYWITVSQDFSIYRLQNLIAKAIKIDNFNEEGEMKRAATLSRVLKQKQNSVLILDDLWNHFPFERVGIPIGVDGCICKLVLTSRLLDVCRRMGCHETLRVNTLGEGDAWKLFLKIFGEPLPSNTTEFAKSIATECAGLPLGIKTMAGSMRGLDDVCEWRNALRKLQDSKAQEVDEEDEVFKVLKFSYDRLSDLKLQKCFLYCTLFPEDHKVYRSEFIEYLIDEEVITGESRATQFDEGHSILNRLQRVCLLEGGENISIGRYVKMHDLIRDMAIKIMQRDLRALVEAGKQLTKMPEMEKLAENITKCSLMYNEIEEIPPSYSPKCPNLSTLLLCHNRRLKSIPTSFFEQLDGLKVLNLSQTGIEELPCPLVNLSALLLRSCKKLRRLPSLATLKALKKLDLNDSDIGEVQGIECLSDLKYLDFRGTNIKQLKSGILSMLSNLQFLNLGIEFPVRGAEVAHLVKLETLICRFSDVSEFNAYTSIFAPNLSQFFLWVGEYYGDVLTETRIAKVVNFNECKIDGVLILPFKVEELSIQNCYSETSTECCLQNVTKLKQFTIEEGKGIVCLSSLFSSVPTIFQSLEEIVIYNLDDLQFLFRREVTIPLPTFRLLKEFRITNCPRIKRLFPLALLSNLQSLEKIDVLGCESMEELIAIEESHHNMEFTLPKLKRFQLWDLPELKSICSPRLICNSIEEIVVHDCPKLKQIPISLVLTDDGGRPFPLPSLQRINIYPYESWDLFEFEHPNSKDVVLPLCTFPILWRNWDCSLNS